VGFSRRTAENEDEALKLVRLFQQLTEGVAGHFGGRVVKFTGDGALVEFSSTEAAVKAACSLRATFSERAKASGVPDADLHIGIHVGEVATAPDGDIYGEGLNVAARLEGVAEPGQVLASKDVWRQLRQRPGFEFESLGERKLKGYDRPRAVYAVDVESALKWDVAEDGALGFMGWRAFLAKLRRRKVLRAAGIYITLAFVVVSIVLATFPALLVPSWITRAVVVAVIAGFPLALVLAWEFEITPEGVRRARPVPGESHLARREKLAYLGFGVLIALVGLGLSVRYLPIVEQAPAGLKLDPNRLAVLYFDDFSEGQELGFLVDGLTDALINELGQVSGLEVVSRSGVQPFADANVPVDSIARVLDAGTLVQGSVAESGDLLRVTVQFIDGASGTVIESENLERPRGEVFALQDDLAQQVAEFLRRRLGEEVRLREMRAGSQSVEAWELVQRATKVREEAIPLLEAGELDASALQFNRADSLLARAETLDPAWVEPVIQRGWLAFWRGRRSWSYDQQLSARWFEIGLGHADRALNFESDHPEARSLRGHLKYWRWILRIEPDPARAEQLIEEAEQDLRAAIAANPAEAAAHALLSGLLAARGATVEAALSARRAYEADAYLRDASDILWRLFVTDYDLNKPTEASRWCREGYERFPEEPRFVECPVWHMSMPGAVPDLEEAWTLLGEYVELRPPQEREFWRRWMQLAVAAAVARAGLADSAMAVAARARGDEEIDPDGDLIETEALVYTIAGDHDEAVRLLTALVEAHPSKRTNIVESGWWYNDLKAHPGWQALANSEE
jgi:TolB-like protein